MQRNDSKGATMVETINELCGLFIRNPKKKFKPSKIAERYNINQCTVRSWFYRLKTREIIKSLGHGEYILLNREKGISFNKNRCKTRWASPMHPPHRIRAKAHNLSIGTIDLCGEPLEWLIKLNMLTKPNEGDPAQNVGLRDGIAERFNMRISLCSGKALVYPIKNGWESEFLNMFSWCDDFVNRLTDINENMEIAINYQDLQRLNPELADIPFEDVKGLILEHNGMHIQLCASQFKEGEICIRSDSVEETANLSYKLVYGKRNLAEALKETTFEKSIHKQLGTIQEALDRLPFNLASVISGAVQEGVEKGIKNAFNEIAPTKPDEGIDVT